MTVSWYQDYAYNFADKLFGSIQEVVAFSVITQSCGIVVEKLVARATKGF